MNSLSDEQWEYVESTLQKARTSDPLSDETFDAHYSLSEDTTIERLQELLAKTLDSERTKKFTILKYLIVALCLKGLQNQDLSPDEYQNLCEENIKLCQPYLEQIPGYDANEPQFFINFIMELLTADEDQDYFVRSAAENLIEYYAPKFPDDPWFINELVKRKAHIGADFLILEARALDLNSTEKEYIKLEQETLIIIKMCDLEDIKEMVDKTLQTIDVFYKNSAEPQTTGSREKIRILSGFVRALEKRVDIDKTLEKSEAIAMLNYALELFIIRIRPTNSDVARPLEGQKIFNALVEGTINYRKDSIESKIRRIEESPDFGIEPL